MNVSPLDAFNTQAAAAVIAIFLLVAVLFGDPDGAPAIEPGGQDAAQVTVQGDPG